MLCFVLFPCGYSRLFTVLGQYCVGDTVTLADVFLLPQVFHAEKRFDINVMDGASFPRISKVVANCSQLSAFHDAHAYAQPDAPREHQQAFRQEQAESNSSEFEPQASR